MKKTSLLILSCLLGFGLLLQAQTVTYENAPKKAKASFDRAIDAVRTYQTKAAIGLLQEAIKAAPNFTDAYGQMGLCYVEL